MLNLKTSRYICLINKTYVYRLNNFSIHKNIVNFGVSVVPIFCFVLFFVLNCSIYVHVNIKFMTFLCLRCV